MKQRTTASSGTGIASADDGIAGVFQAYEKALNASDTSTVIALFASDAVFMPPNSASTVGVQGIEAAYKGIFQAISFETKLHIEEMMHVAPDWAFVRTSSNGFVTVHAIGQRVPDANHELFILNRGNDGKWKIARYCFSTTLPLRQ